LEGLAGHWETMQFKIVFQECIQ